MQLAVPTALMWSLLAIPVVIFYILKIRMRRVPVSTVMFWNQIFDEKKPRSIWQKLRHLLSLLVQLAFLALLVFALADPFFNFEELNARRIVLVVDNSASMNATDEEETRLDAAKRYGFELVRGLRLRDEMAIIAAGSAPTVEVGLTSHQKTLRQALDRINASDGPTNVSDAVELARRLLSDHDNPEIVLLTDGGFKEAEEYDQADDIRLVKYGKETANVGITQFQVRRSLIDTIGYQILIEIQNFSDEEKEFRLEVNLPNELVDVVPLKLAANEKWARVLNHTSTSGGHLVATIGVEDGLACDNSAVALLPKREAQPVLLVSEKPSLYLQSALSSIPLVDLSVTNKIPESIPKGTIAVFDRIKTDKVIAGNTFFIQPTSSTDLWEVGQEISEPIVTQQLADSPLMMHVQLENVLMPQARAIKIPIDHQVLAESLGKHPLFSSINHVRGKTLLLMVDLEKADLPLRTAFPIMITNAMAWFQGQQGELQLAIRSGELAKCNLGDETNVNANHATMLTAEADKGKSTSDDTASDDTASKNAVQGDSSDADLAESAESVAANPANGSDKLVLTTPQGNDTDLPPGTSKLTVGPLDHCGVWQIRKSDVPEGGTKTVQDSSKPGGAEGSSGSDVLFEFACNLSNATESDIRVEPRDVEETQAGFASILGGRPVWFYLVAIGFVLSAVEWFLYQRRWIS